jgi:hypothetical protein
MTEVNAKTDIGRRGLVIGEVAAGTLGATQMAVSTARAKDAANIPMADPKTKLDEIIANIPRRSTPREPVTREELERQANEAAEDQTIELEQEYEEAKQAYEDAFAEAYERNLEELLEEHEDDLSD